LLATVTEQEINSSINSNCFEFEDFLPINISCESLEDVKNPNIEKIYRIKQNKAERRKRKAQLKQLMNKVTKKRVKKSKPQRRALNQEGSIRTTYEKIYESYCKLLGQPYLIDHVYCFNCNNFYWYGDSLSYPKKCQVCQVDFTGKDKKKINEELHIARPDFIIDFNTNENRIKYKQDAQYHRLNNIKKYQQEYLKKIGIIRIDGGVHNRYHVQKRDYFQYLDFKERCVKVFIVKNDLIDELLDRKDNGKSLLELVKNIGDAVIDEELYKRYTEDRDFKEYTKKPFKL
jgi:hypothetical protein